MMQICLLLSIALLSACSTTPPTDLVPTQVNNVNEAQAWEIQGKLAVTTSEDKFSTNLYWLHSQDSNEIKLTTMLGTTVLSLSTAKGMAHLDVDGNVYQHKDAQQLLTQVTGWSIPIDDLPLWITGQVGQNNLILSQDAQNRPRSLITLNQSPAWQVEFVSWQTQSGAELPKLIKLQRGELKLKLQVNQWHALTAKDSAQPITLTE